mgnify:CR=1 FL=1
METADPPVVMVNQAGYLPDFRKTAVYRGAETDPVEFELVDAAGVVLLRERTQVYGPDTASGDLVHRIDFSNWKDEGGPLRLRVNGQYSQPFSVGKDVYRKMKLDALSFFYHQRSGVPIEMPFAGRENLARPAGHPEDAAVECLPPDAFIFTSGQVDRRYACSGVRDVSGGWYDAGDHGKYVVNGGAALWTLLNLFERARYGGSNFHQFADGTLSIPENTNRVPDILDEARHELAFFLKMQEEKGPFAGMLHHKIHSDQWTGLPLAPHADTMPRHLYPVTTQATLNGAAVFAMAARIYDTYDREFAATCLKAAKAAWKAAKKNPQVVASTDGGHGGGPYDDPRADDEFYWAAAELFITTGEEVYKKELVASRYFKVVPSFLEFDEADGVFTWKDIAPLGNLSLAVTPSRLGVADVIAIRRNIINAAAQFAKKAGATGYGAPLTVGPKGTYPWGSNSNIINALIVMGLAFDFSGDLSFVDEAADAMGYLLGRNPMDTCYVTGYGARPVRHPHHRFFADQLDPAFPAPPPGIFSGGPNSGIQDDHVKELLKGCAPAKCYVDHIQSWSTNEIAINWNASFAWVAAFLDDAGTR